jgi:hypothetical protein
MLQTAQQCQSLQSVVSLIPLPSGTHQIQDENDS